MDKRWNNWPVVHCQDDAIRILVRCVDSVFIQKFLVDISIDITHTNTIFDRRAWQTCKQKNCVLAKRQCWNREKWSDEKEKEMRRRYCCCCRRRLRRKTRVRMKRKTRKALNFQTNLNKIVCKREEFSICFRLLYVTFVEKTENVVHCWCHWNCLCSISKLNSYFQFSVRPGKKWFIVANFVLLCTMYVRFRISWHSQTHKCSTCSKMSDCKQQKHLLETTTHTETHKHTLFQTYMNTHLSSCHKTVRWQLEQQ